MDILKKGTRILYVPYNAKENRLTPGVIVRHHKNDWYWVSDDSGNNEELLRDNKNAIKGRYFEIVVYESVNTVSNLHQRLTKRFGLTPAEVNKFLSVAEIIMMSRDRSYTPKHEDIILYGSLEAGLLELDKRAYKLTVLGKEIWKDYNNLRESKKEDFYSVQVTIDTNEINEKDFEKDLEKIIKWDSYDKIEHFEYRIYSFTKSDWKRIEKVINKYNIEDVENINDNNMEKNTWQEIKEIAKIQVKRKYTEIYPAINVGYHAKIRNEMVKYMGQNQIMTEDEFEDLLVKVAKQPELWKKRNASLYEKDDQGYIKLTKRGLRVFNGLNNQVNEINNEPIIKEEFNAELYDVSGLSKVEINTILKFMYDNDVEYSYDQKAKELEIIDDSNLTKIGQVEFEKLLKNIPVIH